jgi:arabinogalactan oligomer/maltooligosaccharide transport system permease protein
MKKIQFHIFLMFVAVVILSPLLWVFFASFTEATQAPYLVERIFSPEHISTHVKGNSLTVEYKMRDLIGANGEQGKPGEAEFTFGADNANKYILVVVNSYDLKLSTEVLDAPFDPKADPDKKWLISLSLDSQANVRKTGFTVNSHALLNLFNVLTLQNYKDILWDPDFRTWLTNSFIVAFATAFISILFGFISGYAFSRFRFPGKKVGLLWVLTTQLFPLAMMIVPFYVLAAKVFPAAIPGLQIVDTLWGLVLIYTATALPFSIWLLKGFFDTIPIELEEAAAIDGANLPQLLVLVLLPLTRPALFTSFLFAFVQSWNEYAIASIFMSDPKKVTLPFGIKSLLANNNVAGFAAAAVIVSAPIVVLFLSMKKELVEGATLGAVKG